MNFFKSKTTEMEASLQNLQEQYDSLNQTFEDTRSELHTMTEKFATMEGEFNRVSEENKVLLSQVEELKVENVEIAVEATEIDTIASAKAIDIIAEIGTTPVEITEDEPEVTVLQKFNALKGQEAANFYQENRVEILNSLKR